MASLTQQDGVNPGNIVHDGSRLHRYILTGAQVVLMAQPRPGYVFKEWEGPEPVIGTEPAESPILVFNMPDNPSTRLTAQFVLTPEVTFHEVPGPPPADPDFPQNYPDHPDIRYGFDDFTSPLRPWKSIAEYSAEPGAPLNEDDVLVRINGENPATAYFHADDTQLVTDISPSSADQESTLTLTAGNLGESAVAPHTGASPTSDKLGDGELRVAGYRAKEHLIGLVYVTQVYPGENPDPIPPYADEDSDLAVTVENLEEYLNMYVFNQCVVRFDISDLGEVEVHYDLNEDGVLTTREPDGPLANSGGGDEVDALIEAVALALPEIGQSEFRSIVYIVNGFDGLTAGYASLGGSWTIVSWFPGKWSLAAFA